MIVAYKLPEFAIVALVYKLLEFAIVALVYKLPEFKILTPTLPETPVERLPEFAMITSKLPDSYTSLNIASSLIKSTILLFLL